MARLIDQLYGDKTAEQTIVSVFNKDIVSPIEKGEQMLERINETFNKGLISEQTYEGACQELDELIKAQTHKYIRREGVKGNYKYIYKEGEGSKGSRQVDKRQKHELDEGLDKDQIQDILDNSTSREIVHYANTINKDTPIYIVNALHDKIKKLGGSPTFKKRKEVGEKKDKYKIDFKEEDNYLNSKQETVVSKLKEKYNSDYSVKHLGSGTYEISFDNGKKYILDREGRELKKDEN
jgi:hypothetical protein